MKTYNIEATNWEDFFLQCLRSRIRPEELEPLMTYMDDHYPITGSSLAITLLERQISKLPDPLVVLYFEKLLTSGKINVDEALHALLKRFLDRDSSADENRDGYHENLHNVVTPFEDIILSRVAVTLANGTRPKSTQEARKIVYNLFKWISALLAADTTETLFQAVTGSIHQPSSQSSQVRESLGMLIISALENTKLQSILQNSLPKGLRQNFTQSLALYASYLSQTSSNVANRLELLRNRYAAPIDEDVTYSVATAPSNIEPVAVKMTVVDLPLVNSRCGLYIFLNSLLIAQPFTDNKFILNYLLTRYKNDLQTSMKDLVIASFDILSNAFYRSEASQLLFSMRSFLVNKVPILLSCLCSQAYQPVNAEICVAQAMVYIDPNAFPSFSQTFDMMNGVGSLSDVRQDFLYSCALHQLIAEESIEKLLGEPPMSGLPSGGRYIKDELVKQCLGKAERLEELLGEIESMDGNAGAIVGAFAEITRGLCYAKETVTLKSICNIISKRPQSMDIILQFISPYELLQPLCQLLQKWKYEEDQGEYQPIYDEFGAIFLLVLCFVHRYQLIGEDIGAERGSFVSEFLVKGYSSKQVEELSDSEKDNVSGWLRGLLDPDGFNDELMSSCKPQQFYLLVPTLFCQMIVACAADLLDLETLKVGLEYLLETFLLPSLVGATLWMAYYIQQEPKHATIVLQILQKLVIPSTVSGDAKAIHSVVLSIVSQDVSRSLVFIKSKDNSNQNAYMLLNAFQSFQSYERSLYSSVAELGSWKAASGGTLKGAFRYTLQSLFTWSSNVPTSYSHKLVLSLVRIVGARRTLSIIIEELKIQTGDVSAIALDIATALIAAPSTENSQIVIDPENPNSSRLRGVQKRLNLRDALRLEASNASNLFSSDPLAAETIARLDARVEAQLAFISANGVLQAPTHGMAHPIDITTEDSAVAVAAAVNAENISQPMDISTIGIDLGVDNTSNDFELGHSNAALGDADEDIFAGITLDSSF